MELGFVLFFFFLRKFKLYFCASIAPANTVNDLPDVVQEMWQALTPQSDTGQNGQGYFVCPGLKLQKRLC